MQNLTCGMRCSIASANSVPTARPMNADMTQKYVFDLRSAANTMRNIPGRAVRQMMRVASVPKPYPEKYENKCTVIMKCEFCFPSFPDFPHRKRRFPPPPLVPPNSGRTRSAAARQDRWFPGRLSRESSLEGRHRCCTVLLLCSTATTVHGIQIKCFSVVLMRVSCTCVML